MSVYLDASALVWRLPRRISIEPGGIAAATKLVQRQDLGLRVPDALHIAMAHREAARMVTFDKRMATAAAQSGLVTIF